MNILELTVANPDELLAVYGAGAVTRIERATTVTGFIAPNGNGSTGGTEITPVTIVSGDTVYVTYDIAGAATDWYRLRYSKLAPTSAPDYGSFSAPFQAIAQGYTSLSRVKTRIRSAVSDTANDDFLRTCVDAVNAEMTRKIGGFIGPSADTLRLLDGCDAVRGGTRLYVPGGILTLTAVRIAPSTGGTLAAATLTDFYIGPKSWEKGADAPFRYISISELSGARFYYGYSNVELTGTFGWPAVPAELAEMADAAVVRMDRARSTGQTDVVALEDGSAIISRFFSGEDRAKLAIFAREMFAGVM